MRLLVMHKNDPNTEAGLPPPKELVERMGAYIGDLARRGAFLGGEGLSGSRTRTRLTFRGGQATIKHGPYAGEHELPANMLVLRVASREAAIGWAERYGKILGDGELELGKVNEPWDLGMMPIPEDPPLRFLLIEKATPASEAGQPRSPRQKADLTRLATEMRKAGVLQSTEALAPSDQAKRLHFTANRMQVLDGPFTETKELVGGFAILQLPSIEAAIEECRRYAEILGGTLEIDIRPTVEPDER
jgi:hypothetical protein